MRPGDEFAGLGSTTAASWISSSVVDSHNLDGRDRRMWVYIDWEAFFSGGSTRSMEALLVKVVKSSV